MPTIVFVSAKGGVGKTTSALLLALGLLQSGRPGPGAKIALIDSDPNLPLTAWADLPGRPAALALFQAPTFADLPAALRKARAASDWVIVDTEGGAPRMAGWAVAEADLVVTPLAASPLEAREALKAAALVAEMERRQGRKIAFTCLLARTPTAARRSVDALRARLADAGVPLLATALADKEAFRALFANGGGLEGRRVAGAKAASALQAAYTADIAALVEAEDSGSRSAD